MSRNPKTKKAKAPKLRCFLGLEFPLANTLSPLIDRLAKVAVDPASRLRLVAPENLHVTLKFLGAVEPQRLPEIGSTVGSICAQSEALHIECQGMGLFKQSVWIGIAENSKLETLALELDKGCQSLGFSGENIEFVPHVTVARFDKQARMQLTGLLDEFQNKKWGEYSAPRVNLYRSDTLPEGARYISIEQYRLGNPQTT